MSKRTAVITGGAKGIGRGIAEILIEDNVQVCLIDFDGEALSIATTELNNQGGTVRSWQVDVSSEYEVDKAFESINSLFGGIDILVNCAGISRRTLVEDMSVDEWRKIIDVNLNGTFITCKAALSYMLERRFGRIVNIASIAAKRISYMSGVHYTASKAGILGLTKHLAYEVAPHGITVNAICPGTTVTPLVSSQTTEMERKKRLDQIPLGRLMTPLDHANVVKFLISDQAEAVTGQAIDVDGGALLGWVDYETYRTARKQWTTGSKSDK